MPQPFASLGHTKLVLAADDNPNNLRLLEVILEFRDTHLSVWPAGRSAWT